MLPRSSALHRERLLSQFILLLSGDCIQGQPGVSCLPAPGGKWKIPGKLSAFRRILDVPQSCRHSWTYFLLLPLAVLIVSCGYALPRSFPSPFPIVFSSPCRTSAMLTTWAAFFAGVPGRPGSPFAELENEPAWKEHRQAMDKAWAKMQDDRLPAMSAFQKTEFSGKPNRAAPSF